MDDDVKKIIYVMTHGVDTPERCATPFFMATTAAVMEHDVCIYFTMNGTQLLRKGVPEKVGPKGDRGQPLRYFMDQALDAGVKLLVCPSSLDLHDMTMDDVLDGVKAVGAAAFNDMALEADAVISF